MFKKSEESEWTRFSRALGGQPAATPDDEAAGVDEPEEAVTLAQAPSVDEDVYLPPPPPPPVREPEPVESEPPAYTPPPPPVAVQPASTASIQSPQLDREETVIGEGASIEGTVRSDQSIRIHGAVQGEIESKQRVVVEASSHVAARITAEQVMVLGEVNGSIECSGRLEIASSARVTGEVSASTLVIQEGAFFEGNLRMSSESRDPT
jgi:cytoskeletal protein CcmA (bactofilin family)